MGELYEQPYCTDDSDILFLFLLTNVLIVRRFGYMRLLNNLNALHVDVNVDVLCMFRSRVLRT